VQVLLSDIPNYRDINDWWRHQFPTQRRHRRGSPSRPAHCPSARELQAVAARSR